MTKTYLQLAREIATLQAAAEKQLTAEKKEAVARLNEVIAKYDLSAADLKFPGAGASSAQAGTTAKSTREPAALVAKYTDGGGNTWGGRGPRPAWLREAIAAGKRMESFARSVAPAAQPVMTAAVSATAVPRKKAGFTVAPKYRHPGTGDTWSGRGSAPRWLKEALRKRGTKLDDFLIAKPTDAGSSGSPAKAPAPGVASKRKLAASALASPKKPLASAKAAPVKARAAKKAGVSKTSPKNAPVAKKTSLGAAIAATGVKKTVAKKSTKVSTPPPVVVPKKKPAATKQPVATKATSTAVKPARKAVAAKKTRAATSAPEASAGLPPTAVPSIPSATSDAPVSSPVV